MKLIETKTLATAQAFIEFTSIPDTFTDLVVVCSLRNSSAGNQNGTLTFNGSTSGYSERLLFGNGATTATDNASGSLINWADYHPGTNATANTFGNSRTYIPNYTGSNAKSVSSDAVSENNGTTAIQYLNAALWNNSAAITSLRFAPSEGANFVAGSTISLYGIGGAGDGYAPKATGGTMVFANGYWYHTFTGSGTFTATSEITGAEVLVVSGGGGGGDSTSFGYYMAGGGGAGGVKQFSLSLAPNNYAITVGAGGAGSSIGVASSFASLAATTGGGFGALANNANPLQVGGNGGSGGGGAGTNFSSVGGSGVAGEGFNGGNGIGSGSSGGRFGGGGGGAGSGGGTTGGGAGTGAFNAWAAATNTGELVSGVRYFGGGGGGGSLDDPGANGGIGGGGDGGDRFSASGGGTVGDANTGGGGGGMVGDTTTRTGRAGGSGIVIVRYLP